MEVSLRIHKHGTHIQLLLHSDFEVGDALRLRGTASVSHLSLRHYLSERKQSASLGTQPPQPPRPNYRRIHEPVKMISFTPFQPSVFHRIDGISSYMFPFYLLHSISSASITTLSLHLYTPSFLLLQIIPPQPRSKSFRINLLLPSLSACISHLAP